MELKEQLLFLKSLQKQLISQDKDYQESPRFWVVGDCIEEPCWEDQADYIIIGSSQLDLYEKIDEFRKCLDECGYLDKIDEETRRLLWNYNDESKLSKFLNEELGLDTYLIPQHKVHTIKPDTFFITKEECQRHINSNRHHYSEKAHTYAMTAWRSPQVEKLWSILETIDIDNILEKIGE